MPHLNVQTAVLDPGATGLEPALGDIPTVFKLLDLLTISLYPSCINEVSECITQ